MLQGIQKQFGLPEKAVVVGTKNRWFHKKMECERLIELRTSIEEFQLRRQPGDGARRGGEEDEEGEVEALKVPNKLDDDDWMIMEKYVKAVHPFCTLAKYLGGDKYPTGGSVIPAIDQIKEDLAELFNSEPAGDSKDYLESLLNNLEKRFKSSWKFKAPYSCLTFLDPRYVDLYCLDEDVFKKLKDDIKYDSLFEEDAANEPVHIPEMPQTLTGPPTPTVEPTDKRAQLLLKKQELSGRIATQPVLTFEVRVDAEIVR